MEQIVLSKNLIEQLNSITDALHDVKYFGTYELAENYVNKIYSFIATIPKLSTRKCKTSVYGDFFARYDVLKSSTQYFITYNVVNNKYYIEYIFNSKTIEYLAIKGI